eukprot:2367782-Rhodomonas_salina.1
MAITGDSLSMNGSSTLPATPHARRRVSSWVGALHSVKRRVSSWTGVLGGPRRTVAQRRHTLWQQNPGV